MLWGNIPLTAEYRLVYEAPTGPYESLQISISYLARGPLALAILNSDTSNGGTSAAQKKLNSELRFTGFRAQIMYRFFVLKIRSSPQGFYVGPHASYSYLKIYRPSNKDLFLQWVFMNASIQAGFQGVISHCFAIDFFTGLGYKYNYSEEHHPNGGTITAPISIIPKLDHVKFTLGMNFGYAF